MYRTGVSPKRFIASRHRLTLSDGVFCARGVESKKPTKKFILGMYFRQDDLKPEALSRTRQQG